jgi:hypothetical protein
VGLPSYRNLIWITVLLAGSCVVAPAQTPANQNAAKVASSPPIQQPSGASGQQPSTLAVGSTNAESGEMGNRVETAGMIPDSASLLPVAAVVGFSFLLGGIVCGTIKKRP